MASFKSGSLSNETCLEWIDMIQGHATDSGIWRFVDPSTAVVIEEPHKPNFSDYKLTATRLADSDDDEKYIFKEENAQYRVDIQVYKQDCRAIGELSLKIVDSLHPNHRKLIFGSMTCRDVLTQINNRLEPTADIQQLKLV